MGHEQINKKKSPPKRQETYRCRDTHDYTHRNPSEHKTGGHNIYIEDLQGKQKRKGIP